MRFRPKRHQYVAFAFVVLSGVIYFARPAAPDTRKWQPLAVPIELKFGKVQTPEFRASLDTKYRLLVACERRIDFRRLECSLGMVDWQREKTCADVPEVIDIRWTLLHNGQLAASGASGDSSGGIYGSDTVEREIGEFSARKGERYALVLYIRRNAGELAVTNPKLLVETQPWEWADAAEGFAMVSFLRVAMFTLAIAGLLILIATPLFARLYGRYRGRKVTPLPH